MPPNQAAVQASLLAASLLGALSASRRVHAGLVLFFLAFSLIGMFTFAFRSGEFTLR